MISGLKALVARLAMGALMVFAGSHAMAAGALAIDTLQGEKYGFSFNHPSMDQAEQRSIRECGGGDCSIVLRFAGECGAYAADQAKGSNAYGWGTGTTSGNTQARAMSECRAKGGSSCKVRAWGCDAIKASASPQGNQQFDQAHPQAAPQSNNNNGNNNSRPAAGGFPMMGEWLVDYVSSSGYTASGTLRVTQSLGNGSFQGVMVLAFVNSGVSKRVQQDAAISVRGNTVIVNASNPVYLLGKGNYSADNFTVTIGSQNLLRGENSDSSGAGGAVVISRK
jgi:hypothetical protein